VSPFLLSITLLASASFADDALRVGANAEDFATGAVVVAAAVPQNEQRWLTYTNARFDYSITYPSSLTAQGEADNSDGQVFRSAKGGAELRVWGSNNALNQTLAGAYKEAVAEINQNGTVTYKVLGRNSFVVSGTRGGKVIYQKTLLRGDVFKSFTFEYPVSSKSTYDPVTNRIANSFKG